MKIIFSIVLAFCSTLLIAQSAETQVMTLGTFHFNFPNLDVNQTDKKDQIDVLDAKYQKEIEDIVMKVSKFKPTIIVIERQPSRQRYTDSTYTSYLEGNHKLKRNEEEQLGFRIAKLNGVKKLYCVDEWGNFTEKISDTVFGRDTLEARKFETYYMSNPDTAKSFNPAPLFKTKGILAELKQANDDDNVKKSLGNYLIGIFKYESAEKDFAGVDFETGRWFSRNLKIFRNIQRIEAKPSDRILVIFGAGHLNLLNYFFDCSPEYNRVSTNQYLK